MTASDIYDIMRTILMRRSLTDRNREHFWVMALGAGKQIVNIERVSLGAVKKTLVEPMEVFSIPLQKRAVNIVLIHNHPSGMLAPSDADKDTTDLLLQVGFIMQTPVLDHLIISEDGYYSFAATGLLDQLQLSNKYVPDRIERLKYERAAMERGLAQGRQERNKELARGMKKEGISIELIAKLTGLSKATVSQLKEKDGQPSADADTLLAEEEE
ncbi:MAG: JAB domain-containing protein [Flavobacteriales bacterium]